MASKQLSKERLIVRRWDEVMIMKEAVIKLFKEEARKKKPDSPEQMKREMTMISLYQKIDYHIKSEQ